MQSLLALPGAEAAGLDEQVMAWSLEELHARLVASSDGAPEEEPWQSAALRPQDHQVPQVRRAAHAAVSLEQLSALVLQYGFAAEVDPKAPLSDVGMDSMGAASFVQSLLALPGAEAAGLDEQVMGWSLEELHARLVATGGDVL